MTSPDQLNSQWLEITWSWDRKSIVHRDDLQNTLGPTLSSQMYDSVGMPCETTIQLRVLTLKEAEEFLAPYREVLEHQSASSQYRAAE